MRLVRSARLSRISIHEPTTSYAPRRPAKRPRLSQTLAHLLTTYTIACLLVDVLTYFRLRAVGPPRLKEVRGGWPGPFSLSLCERPELGIRAGSAQTAPRPPLPSPVLVRGEAGRLRRGRAHGARPITPDRLTGAASCRRGGGVEGWVDCEWRTPLRSSANGCWEPAAGAKCRAGAKREAEANPGFAL